MRYLSAKPPQTNNISGNKLNKLLVSIALTMAISLPINANAFDTKAKYAIVMDYNTGRVLYNKEADVQMVPSSMTKLMTTYIAMERLQQGAIKMEDEFNVSEAAWRTTGSRTFLPLNARVSVETLLNGIIVQSGNDACTVMAEGIAADEDGFAILMNEKAAELGMKNSHFKNSSGFPAEGHYMSARDLAIVSRALIKKFPEYYPYFAVREYEYNKIKQPNRNLLLDRNIGVDGLKTGHTEEAGYGIATSAIKGDKRRIVVVNGLTSNIERADEAEKLLNYGFNYFNDKTLYKAGTKIEDAAVWQGKSDTVSLVAKDDINIIVPKVSTDNITITVTYKAPMYAPIAAGTELAVLSVKVPDMDEYSFPLVAGEEVLRAGWFSRIFSNMAGLIRQ